MCVLHIGGHGHRRQGGVNAPMGVVLLNKSQDFFRGGGIIKPFLQGGTPPVAIYDHNLLRSRLVRSKLAKMYLLFRFLQKQIQKSEQMRMTSNDYRGYILTP